MSPTSTTDPQGIRISIRFKMLLVISAVLLTAVGTYLYLATSLFTRDKLAYIYDMNSSLVGTLAQQTRVSLELLIKEGKIYARDLQRDGGRLVGREAIDADLFTREPDIVRIEVFEGVQPDGSYVGRSSALNQAILDEVPASREALKAARLRRPLPLGPVAAEDDLLYVSNSSSPPEVAIVTAVFKAGPGRVVAMDVRHTRLLRIFSDSTLHESYLIDERGEVIAHPSKDVVISGRDRSGHALVEAALRSNVTRGVMEFVDAETGVELLGAYSRVGIGRLWVLTQIPRSHALRAGRELIERSILFAIAILLAALLVSIFFSRYLSAPIRKLSAATEVIGRGRFDVDVEVHSRDEIGELAAAFNRMAAALKETQSQLIQSEKMAAFGQLGAGITHEVKNPMTGIVGFAQLAQRKVGDPTKTLELLKLIEKEGLRCRDILVNFLKFARASEGEQEPIDVNHVVQEAASMLRHQLNMNRVKLEVELTDNPVQVLGNAPELQQVLMNLAINAQQAMSAEGGNVFVATGRDGDDVLVTVRDDGPGIPENIRGKIFEPFFTTKPSGQGTGLGLSVSFGIIQSHNGTLSVDSTVGLGTTFTIRLPEHRTAGAA